MQIQIIILETVNSGLTTQPLLYILADTQTLKHMHTPTCILIQFLIQLIYKQNKQFIYTALLTHTCTHANTETYVHTRVYLNSILNSIDIQAE